MLPASLVPEFRRSGDGLTVNQIEAEPSRQAVQPPILLQIKLQTKEFSFDQACDLSRVFKVDGEEGLRFCKKFEAAFHPLQLLTIVRFCRVGRKPVKQKQEIGLIN